MNDILKLVYCCNAVLTALDMKQVAPSPEFIVWTGDSVPRTVDVTQSVVKAAILNVTSYVNTTYPDTPVFPCLGAYDTSPSYQMGLT